jgi:hypothetical protein
MFKSELHWLTFQNASCCMGPNFRQYRRFSHPTTLSNSSLFDVFRHCWQRIVQFEPNTMHTNTFTKPYHKANWSSRTNEKSTSTPSRSQRLLEIPARRHYFNDVLRIFLLTRPPRTSSGTGEWIFDTPSPPPSQSKPAKNFKKYIQNIPAPDPVSDCWAPVIHTDFFPFTSTLIKQPDDG